MRPNRRARIPGSTARPSSTGLMTKKFSWARCSAHDTSLTWASGCGPVALTTSTSTGPRRSAIAATNSATCCYGLSYRDVEELPLERVVEVDHVTIFRWVQRFTPLLADAARFCRHAPGDRWFADETYVKVNGVRRHRYQHGQVIDVLASVRRDATATAGSSTGRWPAWIHPRRESDCERSMIALTTKRRACRGSAFPGDAAGNVPYRPDEASWAALDRRR